MNLSSLHFQVIVTHGNTSMVVGYIQQKYYISINSGEFDDQKFGNWIKRGRIKLQDFNFN